MTAASFWSLLAPAIEMAAESKLYGEEGEYAFIPVGIGFLLGALFVYGTDVLITVLGVHSPNMMLGKFKTLRLQWSMSLAVVAVQLSLAFFSGICSIAFQSQTRQERRGDKSTSSYYKRYYYN